MSHKHLMGFTVFFFLKTKVRQRMEGRKEGKKGKKERRKGKARQGKEKD